MTSDPIELLTKVIPETFNAAVKEMREAAGKGDADAKRRHDELLATDGAMRVVLEGKGGKDLYLAVIKGEMKAVEQKPQAPVLGAFAVPFDAMEIGLEELGDEIEAAMPKLKKRITRMSPAKAKVAMDQLAKENLNFHQVIKDTPDFDEVRVKISIGGSEPPAKPAFTVTVDYDTIEGIREKKIKPQAIMSKLQITGDASRAMQLGMEMMQKLQK